ncbi:MAG: hypothetical protein K2K97_11700, partial [Muribaculaceae bacterium]|nr:hypothetical protein [Muribaculaceae bacterium]
MRRFTFHHTLVHQICKQPRAHLRRRADSIGRISARRPRVNHVLALPHDLVATFYPTGYAQPVTQSQRPYALRRPRYHQRDIHQALTVFRSCYH